MKYVAAIGFILAFAGILRLALYFGYRWIDRMLCVQHIDPNKPIVRQ